MNDTIRTLALEFVAAWKAELAARKECNDIESRILAEAQAGGRSVIIPVSDYTAIYILQDERAGGWTVSVGSRPEAIS